MLYRFFRSLFALLNAPPPPNHVVVVLDSGGHTFRWVGGPGKGALVRVGGGKGQSFQVGWRNWKDVGIWKDGGDLEAQEASQRTDGQGASVVESPTHTSHTPCIAPFPPHTPPALVSRTHRHDLDGQYKSGRETCPKEVSYAANRLRALLPLLGLHVVKEVGAGRLGRGVSASGLAMRLISFHFTALQCSDFVILPHFARHNSSRVNRLRSLSCRWAGRPMT